MTPKDGEALFSPHCFPSFQNMNTSGDSRGNSACHLFQPLYGCNDADSTRKQKNHDPANNPHDPVVAARGMSFEEGYCSGSAEACDAVRKSLKPDLESFLSIFEDSVVFQSLVAETTAHRILELAFVMAELVTGTPLSVDVKSLEELKNKLEADIQTAYEMTLTFNPEDGQALKQAFALSRLQWPDHHAVRMRMDAGQPRKGVAVDMQDTCFEKHALGLLALHLEKSENPSTS